jgi:hypothetical protein
LTKESKTVETVVVQQEGDLLDFYVPNPECRRFPDNESAISARFRGYSLNITCDELEEIVPLNLEIEGCSNWEHLGFHLFKPHEISVWDVATDHRVLIAWDVPPHRAGGGNCHYVACGTARLSPKQAEQLIALLERSALQRIFSNACDKPLEEAGLDHKTISRAQQELIRKTGLDDETIKKRREALLIDQSLDEASVEKRRKAIRDRIIAEQFPELQPKQP